MTPPLPPRLSALGFSDDEVDRFLAGQSTPDELARFRDHLRRSPTDAAWVAVLTHYELAHAPDFARDLADGTATATLVKWMDGKATPSAAADQFIAETTVARPSRSVPLAASQGRGAAIAAPRMIRWAWGIAAAAVIAVVAGLVGRSHQSTSTTTAPARTVATIAGQRSTITLTDGSRVTLAPQSRLRIAGDFGTEARVVSLEGEAFFDVRPDPHPFLVRTGRVTTRVLGTTFDVRAYSTDSAVRVAVLSGKVAAGGRRTPVTLTAGTVGLVTDTTATSAVVDNVTRYAEWTSGRLVFDNVQVSAMLEAVGQWYGYAFELTDSVRATRRVTAEFDVGSREETFRAIQSLLDVTMQFNGTTVTLSPRTVSRHDPVPSRRDGLHAIIRPSEVGK